MYISPKFLSTFNRIRQPLYAAHSAGTDQIPSHWLFYYANRSLYIGRFQINRFLDEEDEKNKKVWWEFVSEEEEGK